jgi:threonylcarbamoyladenosine tRNA methylthiotransferase MtaB
MPQLSRELVKARAARLRAAAQHRRLRWLDSLTGSTQRVLVESDGKGHADNFAPIVVPGKTRGDILEVRIAGREGDHLVGACA